MSDKHVHCSPLMSGLWYFLLLFVNVLISMTLSLSPSMFFCLYLRFSFRLLFSLAHRLQRCGWVQVLMTIVWTGADSFPSKGCMLMFSFFLSLFFLFSFSLCALKLSVCFAQQFSTHTLIGNLIVLHMITISLRQPTELIPQEFFWE